MFGEKINAMPVKIKSAILTSIQYGLAVWLLLLTPWFSPNILLLLTQVAGVLLGIWAIFEMRKSKLNPTPLPREGSVLITSGPYQWIRHPMYLALILYFYPVAIPTRDPLTLSVLFVFTVNLVMKLLFEEKLLSVRFKRYDIYSKYTSRLIPWIF